MMVVWLIECSKVIMWLWYGNGNISSNNYGNLGDKKGNWIV